MPKLIIPARLNSKRLPRKPLLEINGIPMIVKTAKNAINAIGDKNVFVATDSSEIIKCCDKYQIQSILTSENCLTGTDRVIEAAKKLTFDNVFNLQGDEPLFPKAVIKEFIEKTKDSIYPVAMGITKIKDEKEFISPKIPKIVFNNKKELLYTSRSRIPGSKNMANQIGFKQVCIYKYKISKLTNLNKNKSKTFFESIEDLELLRMLEIGVKVKCIYLDYQEHFSVDTPEDLKRIKDELDK